MFWCLFRGVFAQCTMREWVFLDVTFMICAWHHHSWFIYVSASIQWALCLKIIWKLKLLCVTSSFLSRVWYGGFITPPALHQWWLSIVFLMNSKTMTGKGVIALRKIFFIVRVWITSLGEFKNLIGGDPEQLDWMLDLFHCEQGFGLHVVMIDKRIIRERPHKTRPCSARLSASLSLLLSAAKQLVKFPCENNLRRRTICSWGEKCVAPA